MVDALLFGFLLGAARFVLELALYDDADFDEQADSLLGSLGDLLWFWVLPSVITIGFWLRLRATPGKLLLRMRVVDRASGRAVTVRQAVVRYLGHFVSTLPLGLGFLWIAIYRNKQAWHDKMAGTLVVVRASTPGASMSGDHAP